MASTVDTTAIRLLPVTTRQPVSSFLRANGIDHMSRGNLFYQLTKRERIQHYKHVIVMRSRTSSFISGPAVKTVLGIRSNVSANFMLDAESAPDFVVFVQSTSHSRVLIAGTSVVLRVSDASVETEEEEEIPLDSTPTVVAARSRPSTSVAAPLAEPALRTVMTRSRAAAIERGPPAVITRSSPRTMKPRGARQSARRNPPSSEGAPDPFATVISTLPPDRPLPVKRKTLAPKLRPKTTLPMRSSSRPQKVQRTSSSPPAPTAPARPSAVPAITAPTPASGSTTATSANAMHDVVFSFDTTGSMFPVLSEVRHQLQAVITRLRGDMPHIRMGVIAHGDYCDAASSYVTRICDFTTDVSALCAFVRNVGRTCGGDFDECYELVLRQTRTELSWCADAVKSLVLVGDATPHEASYPLNDERIDWRTEGRLLKQDGVRVYAVQAMDWPESTSFYRELATLTDGFHLRLDQFASMPDFMLAICYREGGTATLQAYEGEVRARGMNRELHRLFDALSNRDTVYEGGTDETENLTSVPASRFQVLSVDARCSIRDFVERNELLFSPGRGFFEFTKPEKISGRKEVVLVEKSTGDMFTGREACGMIGAGGDGKIKPVALYKFRVFVQSTSYNRVLVPGTGFLYEVDTSH